MLKKGRKNSTPKVIENDTFSPDGAIACLFRSNLCSFLLIKFLIYLESAIGIDSQNSDILISVELASNMQMRVQMTVLI